MASDDTVKRYDCTDGGSKFCQGCYTMTECEYGDYVAWEDFDAMRERAEKAEQTLQRLESEAVYTAAGVASDREHIQHLKGRVDLLEGLLLRARRRLWTNPAETLPGEIDAALAQQAKP